MKWLRITRTRLIILAILLLVGYFLYRRWFAPDSQTWDQATVTRSQITQTLVLSGEIDAKERASLDFQTSGRLAWIGVKEGDQVKKYQAIASLDKSALKKQLEQTLNSYMNNRWTFEQTQSDRDGWKVISDQKEREEIQRIVEKSQFSLNNSVLDVEIQDLTVRWATLTTPIDGIVTQVNPSQAGVNITPATSGFEIINPNTLYFSVNADQNEVTQLLVGQPVNIILDSFDQSEIEGIITQIGYTPKSGEASTVYQVDTAIVLSDDLKQRVRIGMTGDAQFVTDQVDKTLVIPQDYLQSDKDGDYVFIDEKSTKAYVKTGIESSQDVQILEGLQEGQTIYKSAQ